MLTALTLALLTQGAFQADVPFGDVLYGPQSYDAFLFLGQSNMVGINTGRDVAPGGPERLADNVYVLDREDRVAPWHWPPPTSLETLPEPGTLQNIAPSISFMRRYGSQFPERRVLLIQVATGSSGFSTAGVPEVNWAAPGSLHYQPGNLYDLALERASRAIEQGATLRAVVWHQGETDSLALSGAEYGAELRQLVSGLRAALPDDALGSQADLPFILGGLSDFGAATLPQLPTIDATLQLAAMVLPNCTYVSAAGLQPFDAVHFDGPSARAFGQFLANGLLDVTFDATEVPGAPTFAPAPEGRTGPIFRQSIDPLDPRTLFAGYVAATATPAPPAAQGPGNFSKLAEFERYRHPDGFFYLRLTWTNGQAVLWRQRSNPFRVPHQVVGGFELSPVDTSGFAPFQFQGLSRFPDSGRLLGMRPGPTNLFSPAIGVHRNTDTEALALQQGGLILVTPTGEATSGVRLASVTPEEFFGPR
jgi:hypothetical protein